MEIVNLTPHTINIQGLGAVEPSGVVARVQTQEQEIAELAGVPVVKRTFGEVENLPEEKEGVVYLVSALVLNAIKGRKDVMAPDTGPTAVRDEQGRIQAVTRLVSSQ